MATIDLHKALLMFLCPYAVSKGRKALPACLPLVKISSEKKGIGGTMRTKLAQLSCDPMKTETQAILMPPKR